MQVARVLEHRALEAEAARADQERVQLAATRRAVRADLVVERDDLVSVIGAKEHEVARVRLPDESFHRAGEPWLGAIRLEGILARHAAHYTSGDERATARALDAHRVAIDGADQADARMREQLHVKLGAAAVGGDVGIA